MKLLSNSYFVYKDLKTCDRFPLGLIFLFFHTRKGQGPKTLIQAKRKFVAFIKEIFSFRLKFNAYYKYIHTHIKVVNETIEATVSVTIFSYFLLGYCSSMLQTCS